MSEIEPDAELSPPGPVKGRSATLKVLLLMFLALLMLLPVTWLLGLVRERQARMHEAQQRIEFGWGGRQQLIGPFLYLPYRYQVIDPKKGETREYTDVIYLAPTSLDWAATLDPEVRSLGIFDALLYRADLRAQARFDLSEIDLDPRAIRWEEATVVVGVGDPKGIEGTPSMLWNGLSLDIVPAVEIPRIAGLGAVLPTSVRQAMTPRPDDSEAAANAEAPASDPASAAPPQPEPPSGQNAHIATVEVRLKLAGSERLTMVPIASDSQLTIDAPWPSPGFVGSHLPRQRDLSEDGFRAEWSIPALARSLPRRWNSDRHSELGNAMEAESFGADLVLPAGGYQRTERAAKYALLFVGLTFLAFFLFEVLSALRLHPIQYLLVAAALVVFYLLLLALSEHIGFTPAYAGAAIATCLLIAGYSWSVLGSGQRAGIVLFELSLLYSYLYIVLAAEDFALLFGAAGLFAILGLVMWLTRHLDWYQMGSKPASSG